MATDVTTLTDEDLARVLDAARTEYQRRLDLVHTLDTTPGLQDAFLASTGKAMGEPWVQPLGYHDAYPSGWEVTHGGASWWATRDGASGVPGESPDWRQQAEEGELLPWSQPHAGTEYEPGMIVTHAGHVWRNDHTGPNGWEPGTPGSQWTDLGPIDDYTPEGEYRPW